MSEQQIQKQGVSRIFAITLGVICIMLTAGLSGLLWKYSSQIQQISSLESEISNKNSQIQTLTDQKNALQKIVDLQEGTVFVGHQTLIQDPSSYSDWAYPANYAGYIEVLIWSSTTSSTYVRVTYSTSHGVSYDTTIVVGKSGTASFPILPAQIQIRVGNSNVSELAITTVSIFTYP